MFQSHSRASHSGDTFLHHESDALHGTAMSHRKKSLLAISLKCCCCDNNAKDTMQVTVSCLLNPSEVNRICSSVSIVKRP